MNSKRKLRFLFISADTFPPFRVDFTVLFGKEMGARGHVIDSILQSADACSRSYETRWHEQRMFVGRTDLGGSRRARVRKHLYGITHDLKMFGLARTNDYDFIQVKDKFISALLAAIAAKLYRTKFFYWLSFPFPEESLYKSRAGGARYPIYYLLRGWFQTVLLYRIIIPLSDHTFVQSEQMKKDVAANGIPERKLTPVPMGVELEDLPDKSLVPKPATGNIDPASAHGGGQTIVYIGTLARVRHIDFLVRVLHKVRQELSNVTLCLVGDGDDAQDRDIILSEAAALGLEEAVEITGFLPREQALVYVAHADVCASPFYPTPILNSTSPTKLVEYMAMGKAVVANDHPEQRLVIEESQAGICVPYAEEPFAAAIVSLLKDPQNALEMGTRGKEYVRRHRTYGRIADAVERQYMTLCASECTGA